jgi:hypothetical protein
MAFITDARERERDNGRDYHIESSRSGSGKTRNGSSGTDKEMGRERERGERGGLRGERGRGMEERGERGGERGERGERREERGGERGVDRGVQYRQGGYESQQGLEVQRNLRSERYK